ncbi:putative flavoprotein pyridine nucleotide cytochrome reductase family protein [Lyophyllum shimeji]|uniref:NADH-cytochrome b5 reductase n=1 Tax=Lyophyllum shimeji TaxID=47721 RepID=A0A9P3PHR1_LYOSH|nr:putative flavoprotein pyridine nucleotide cytochrome reductase family protein [Lyophyllum shimeji]
MNRYQAAFLASFVLTFASLFLLARYLNSKLLAAGFDISQLILLGLPKEPPPKTGRVTMVDIHNIQDTVVGAVKNVKLDDLKAVDIPFLGTTNLVEVASSPAVVITAAIVVATAFYAKVLHKGRTKPLNPNAWQEYPLEKKIKVSPNTAIYRFTLPHRQDVLGLPVGQHISVCAEINGKDVVRSYTPISNDDDRGYFDLLIKSYEKGNISRHFALLKLGDKIRVKGPKGNFQYSPGLADHLSMIAGGTGITPMIQIIRAALKNPFDKTTITLIYANVNAEDILLKDDLEELHDVHGDRFKIYYVLNNPPPGWKGGVGFVTKEHIKEHLPNPATSNSKLLICGPPPMVAAMKKNFDELKYPAPRTVSKLADQVFVF